MEEYKLLTIDDLCKRWHKSEKTIRRYIADGKIKPCKNLTNMFRPEEIARYEGGESSTFSYIERRNLIAEVELWKNNYKKLNEVLLEILQASSKVANVNIENLK